MRELKTIWHSLLKGTTQTWNQYLVGIFVMALCCKGIAAPCSTFGAETNRLPIYSADHQLTGLWETLRGGDRPKFGDKIYRDVSVIPRSCFEPWLLFRKPCEGRVMENLKRYGTGALRRPSEDVPFADLLEVPHARPRERAGAHHPSLKPQALMRSLVRASLPLGKGIVLAPFMGAGSTITAAKHLGLRSVGVEIDHKYFRMARYAIPKLTECAVLSQDQKKLE